MIKTPVFASQVSQLPSQPRFETCVASSHSSIARTAVDSDSESGAGRDRMAYSSRSPSLMCSTQSTVAYFAQKYLEARCPIWAAVPDARQHAQNALSAFATSPVGNSIPGARRRTQRPFSLPAIAIQSGFGPSSPNALTGPYDL